MVQGFAFEGYFPESFFFFLPLKMLGWLMFGMVVVGTLGFLDS